MALDQLSLIITDCLSRWLWISSLLLSLVVYLDGCGSAFSYYHWHSPRAHSIITLFINYDKYCNTLFELSVASDTGNKQDITKGHVL